jgi:hypothetical protein
LDLDFAGLPRLFDELDCFFDFPDDLPDVLPSELPEVAVVEVVDGPVVVVVEDLPVVVVVAGPVVDGVDDESGSDGGAVVAVVVDDEGVAASVIWIRSSPSLESEFPSLATKVKVSTSTPDGAS